MVGGPRGGPQRPDPFEGRTVQKGALRESRWAAQIEARPGRLQRQYRRDVLQVTEELIPAKTAAGVKLLPFHVVNLLSIRAKASQGHAPSQRYLDKLHREAIEGHEDANPALTKGLEREEAKAVGKSVDGLERWEWRDLNLYRKFTWRF